VGAAQLYRASAETGDSRPARPGTRAERGRGPGRCGDAVPLRSAAGDRCGLKSLLRLLEEAGDREKAERIVHEAADEGRSVALLTLAELRREAGDRVGAERFYRYAVAAGDFDALGPLARMREEEGDRAEVERLALQAANSDTLAALQRLTCPPQWYVASHHEDGLEPDGTPTGPWALPEPRFTIETHGAVGRSRGLPLPGLHR
jgi:hypothetical protein